jgi:hypothetical protein
MKPSNETQELSTPTIKKSKATKTVEGFKGLSLQDMEETLELITEIYDTALGKEREKLNAQVADLQDKQSKLKK